MTTSDSPETPPIATPPENTDEPNSQRPAKPKPGLQMWIDRFVLVIVSILAVIPPALVVADMWFGKLPIDLGGEIWCQMPFLCNSVLPSYFVITLGCFFILAVILFFLRQQTVVVQENPLSLFENSQVSPMQMRIGLALLALSGLGMIGVIVWSFVSQHWPGWDIVIVWLLYLCGFALRAVSPAKLAKLWEAHGELLVSLLLMHLAIVAVLAGYYDAPKIFWLTLILLVAAFANLWRFRRRVPLIFWVSSLALVLYTININGWWTAIIGDDQGFHELAWAFAEKMSVAQVGNFLFQANGVSDSHPYFSSFVQGISMKLFGHGSFGWRFSNFYLCALGVGLFYFFCKSFISQRTALVAACLLAFSQYVMSFGKIGYNNLQALFAVSLALAVTTYALRWKQPFAFALLGSVMALCFYLYPASLYVVPLPILLLLIYDPPISRQAIGRWLVMFTVCAAMIYPLMAQPIYWQTKQAGTLFNNPELVQSVAVIFQHFTYNIFYSILSFLYIAEGHYVVSSFIDPVTAIFITPGYLVLLYQMRRQRFAIFVALAFVFFLFSVGASHDRPVPSTTRMFMMVPWFALFGAWGMVWLDESLKKAGFFAKSKTALIVVLLAAVAAANLYQAYKLSPMRYAATQSTATLYLAVTENIQKAQPNKQKSIAFIAQDNWGYETLLYFKDIYPYLEWFHLFPINITEPVLPADKLALFADPETIIMVAPYLEPEWQNALDAPLTALGKNHCDIWIPDMRKFLVVYFSPDIPSQVCEFDIGLALDAQAAGGPP